VSVFTPAEIGYSGSQRLDIGGHGVAMSKFRDAQAIPRVAFIVDDLASVSRWRPRAVELRGVAVRP